MGDAKRSASATARMRAGWISLVSGSAILVAKVIAWQLTGSQVVFSDAMESIVNVVAAAFMLFAVHLAAQPADDNHPYGHGKIEFVTSGFEGGLIAFAAIVIIFEAVKALIEGSDPQRLGLGISVVAVAGVANLLLGIFLIRTGKEHHSLALIADGKHVISDFWTSTGAVLGLILVWLTDIAWIDPVVAIVVALLLLRTGGGLLREAARGLMDEVDPELVEGLAASLESARAPGIIEVHHLRAIDLASFHHVDLHVVVPEFWSVEEAHDALDAFQVRAFDHHAKAGELQFHVDPCERAYCSRCDLLDCAVRAAPFEVTRPFTRATVADGPAPPAGMDAIHTDSQG